jgi:hypothetical protein
VVAAPPTEFVNVPPTASVLFGESVKLVAAVIVVSPVDVALCDTVQPPAELLNVTPPNVEMPGSMVFPVVVALKSTVLVVAAVKPAPVVVQEPPTVNVPVGSVVVPCRIVKSRVAVALVSVMVQPPPTPSTRML